MFSNQNWEGRKMAYFVSWFDLQKKTCKIPDLSQIEKFCKQTNQSNRAAELKSKNKRGSKMSISLPTNKAEKWARYKMLIKQGSMSWQEAVRAYKYYLTRMRKWS